MSYPTFKCEDCERLCNEVEALKCALTAAFDEIRIDETRGWNAAIDAALTIVKGNYWGEISQAKSNYLAEKIEGLRRTTP